MPARLLNELRGNNIKFNEAEIVFIAHDKSGQIVWLEEGNNSAGLKHILDGKDGKSGHAGDFEKAFGIQRDNLGSYLENVIRHGNIIRSKLIDIGNNKKGYEKIYEHQGNYYVLVGIGSNGFIVSAYPIRKEDI